ncbi:hypothetical protein [Terrisporobacter vanillatitrophus]
MAKKSNENNKMVDKKNNKMVDKKSNKMTDKANECNDCSNCE